MVQEAIAGFSYWVEPNGKLHPVRSCGHEEFAEQVCKNKDVKAKNVDSKDLLTGVLKWVSFTPAGTNTFVSCLGRDRIGENVMVELTDQQIDSLLLLWKVNGVPLGFEYLMKTFCGM